MNCNSIIRKLLGLAFIIFTVKHTCAQSLEFEIKLAHSDSPEIKTKNQLLKLMSAYDLSKWLFTKTVIIESGYTIVPHSYPVLTLNTRHLRNNDLLLSTFIHEELHWYINSLSNKNEILSLSKEGFPRPKEEFPDGS